MCTIISTTDCRDQNSEEKVKSECNEKTNCSIHASDNVLKMIVELSTHTQKLNSLVYRGRHYTAFAMFRENT